MGAVLARRVHHRIPLPDHAVPPVLRGSVRTLADGPRRVLRVRPALAGPARPRVLLRPHRRIAVPRHAPTEVHARRRGPAKSGGSGVPGHYLERRRDPREPRRAVLRRARLAFLTGFRFVGAFLARRALRGAAFFVGFFGGAALTGTAGSTSLYTKSFSRTRSRTFIPTSWPISPRVTSACSTCSESTRCSRFDVGPCIATVSPTASAPSVRRIAQTPILP